MKSKIVLVGGGGHCRSCIDVVEQNGKFIVSGILDLPRFLGKKMAGYQVIGTDDDIPEFIEQGYQFIVTVGQIKSSHLRQALFNQVASRGGQLPVIASPFGYVSPTAEIGQGTIIMHKAVINAGSVIGENCIINTGAIVEHGVTIGSHCHISTGAILNGDVRVDDHTFIGSRTMVGQGVKIGEKSVIGGGINLFKDMPSHTKIKVKNNYDE